MVLKKRNALKVYYQSALKFLKSFQKKVIRNFKKFKRDFKKWMDNKYHFILTLIGIAIALFIIVFFIFTSVKKKEITPSRKYIIISYNKILFKSTDIKSKTVHEAIEAYETGYMEKSKFLFQSALDKELNLLDKKIALANLGNIFDDFKQYELALKYLNQALEVDKTDGLIYHNLGIVYKHKKEYPKAIESLLQAIKFNRKFVKSYLSLASLYYYLQDYMKSLEYYKLAESLNPVDYDIKYNIGICYFQLQDIEKAKETLNNLIETDHVMSQIKYEAAKSLGNYHAQKKKYGQAIYYFRKALKFNEHYDAHIRLGNLYKIQGEMEKSLHHFEKAYKLNKEKDSTIKNLAELYFKFGDYDKAIEHYKYIVQHFKAKAEVLLLLGEIYMKKGEMDYAIDYYQKALEYSPTPDEAKIAYINLGNLFMSNREYKQALDYYQKALEIDKTDVNIYYNIGLIYLENKDYQNALKYINEVIEQNPNNVKLYLIKSKILFKSDKINMSIRNYNTIIEKFPKEIAPYFELGNLYYHMKDYDNAKQFYKAALNLEPGTDYRYKIYANLAIIYNEQRNFKTALEKINNAYILNSKDALINYTYGLIYFNSGVHQKAKDYFHQALRMPGDDHIKSKSYLGLGNIHFEEKNYELAKSMYTKSLNLNPDYTEAHYNLKIIRELHEKIE
jgi:tetratricopeptide (TPR) repeat protein